MSAHSVQPFGHLKLTFIQRNELKSFYYIDYTFKAPPPYWICLSTTLLRGVCRGGVTIYSEGAGNPKTVVFISKAGWGLAPCIFLWPPPPSNLPAMDITMRKIMINQWFIENQTVQNLMAAIRHSFVSCKPRLCTDNVSNRNSVVRNGAQFALLRSKRNCAEITGPAIFALFLARNRVLIWLFYFKGSVRKEWKITVN